MIKILYRLIKKIIGLPFRFCRWGCKVEIYLRQWIALSKIDPKLAKFVPLRKRIWAMRKGFYADRVLFYGLTKENLHKYMPDFIHDTLHPINEGYSSMIDNKMQLPFLLKDFSEYVPIHHYLLYNSEMIGLSSNDQYRGAYDPGKLLSFLKMNNKLIIKPLAESGGEGVLLIETCPGSFLLNGILCNENEMLRHLANLDHHIVCQFVEQHQYANELYPLTTNTIRFITMHDYKEHKAFIGACFHRIGTSQTIPVDNFGKGGLLCSIDMESGIIGRALAWSNVNGVTFQERHPDTEVCFSGKMIPSWDHVKAEVMRMAEQLAFLPYMGWDIVITNNGFKVLEINSLPTLLWQIHNPISDNPMAKEFYRQIIDKKNRQ